MTALPHLSLVGDGDEIDAITAVEREFGVSFVPNDAPQWLKVGDVFDDLVNALAAGAVEDPATWTRFCHAITLQSGDDPMCVTPTTLFLLPSGLSVVDQIINLLKR